MEEEPQFEIKASEFVIPERKPSIEEVVDACTQ
jgi:hypothetical protein